jgi:hypothetical protein
MTIYMEFGDSKFEVEVVKYVGQTFRQEFEALDQLYTPLATDVIQDPFSTIYHRVMTTNM